LIEKPMALTTAECDALIETARANSLCLGVNHNAMYHPAYRQLRDDLDRGRIGRVRHVLSVMSVRLAQFDAGRFEHWMFRQPENILFEQGPHPMSQICDLLGEVREARTLPCYPTRLPGSALFYPSWQVSLVGAEGTAQMFIGYQPSLPESWLHVIGQDGSARVDLLNNVYALERRTHFVDPLDICVRRLHEARQVAAAAIWNIVRYGLHTLKVGQRSDPFYEGMHGSIAAFYESLRRGDTRGRSASLGRMVIDGLAQIASAADCQGVAPAAAFMARSRPRRQRDGDILVLGGTGFIGKRLVEDLSRAGKPVRLMVRGERRVPEEVLQWNPSVWVGDVRNPEDVHDAIEGCAAVVHLVAGAPSSISEFEQLFVGGTRNVAEACLKWKVPKLVFASSIAVYDLGVRGRVVTEDTPMDPRPGQRSPYARYKIASELLLGELFVSHGLPVTIVRPGLVVGQGGLLEHSGVGFWPCPTHCVTWGTVNAPLPFVLVDDVSSGILGVLRSSATEGSSFNLIGDVRLTASEYVEILGRESHRVIHLHRQSLVKWAAVDLLKWGIKAVSGRSGNARPSVHDLAARTLVSPFDCTKAKQVLHWRPEADKERFVERAIRQPQRTQSS
jgi:nucleoside-diphosphate-sugar epimerase